MPAESSSRIAFVLATASPCFVFDTPSTYPHEEAGKNEKAGLLSVALLAAHNDENDGNDNDDYGNDAYDDGRSHVGGIADGGQ
jgi:hypothetical protein